MWSYSLISLQREGINESTIQVLNFQENRDDEFLQSHLRFLKRMLTAWDEFWPQESMFSLKTKQVIYTQGQKETAKDIPAKGRAL